jgi:hypothetical protein
MIIVGLTLLDRLLPHVTATAHMLSAASVLKNAFYQPLIFGFTIDINRRSLPVILSPALQPPHRC